MPAGPGTEPRPAGGFAADARLRAAFALAVGVVGILGLVTLALRGPATEWLANPLGGMLYVLLWLFLWLVLCPRWRPSTVALAVLGITCALEFLQLWQPPWLQAVRATLPGRLLLGDTFYWLDFPGYAAGAALGAWFASRLQAHVDARGA